MDCKYVKKVLSDPMTKKQIEEKKKKELAQEEEYFKQVDKPESQGGGRKYVVDRIELEKKAEQKQKDDINTDLQSKQQRPFAYKEALANYGMKLMHEAELGSGWYYMVIPTDGTDIRLHGRALSTQQGVLLLLMSPTGNIYSRGIRTINDAVVDSKAMETLVTQAENTADSEKGLLLGEKDNEDMEPKIITK